MENKRKQINEAWKFWKPIICKKDGTINISQLKKELSDFHHAINEVPTVYAHVTGGDMSYISYFAKDVIAVADEYYQKQRQEDTKEFLDTMKSQGTIRKKTYDALIKEVDNFI
jgi:methionyl-tRNA formyltransferase